ncbi:MAG: DUF420 domain-containing protein [Cytophagales bacterium]|nr:DUF420 domain-containing protein [Cytophaga sp.]
MPNASINKVLNDKSINIVAVTIPVAVAVLLGLRFKIDLGAWTSSLPHVNALINSLTSLFLLIGLAAIRRGNISIHRMCMLICVALGTVFLVTYILYHFTHTSTSYGGTGLIKNVYYFLLITHIVLAAVVVYFVLKALYYALNSDFERHKKIVKWAYPIWLYVSVTGVLVYWMISPYYNH